MAREQVDETIEEGAAPEVERTVREDIEAARDEVNARHEAEATQDSQAGRKDGSGGSQRGGDGRFQRREPTGSSSEPPQGQQQRGVQGQEQPGQQPTTGQPVPQGNQPHVLAPNGWSQEAKALWNALPPVIKAQVQQREADIHKQATAMDQERSIGREFATIAQNYQDVITRSGVHPLRYFDDTLRVMRTLVNGSQDEKIQMLLGVAQRQGIDFRALFARQGAQPGVAPGQPGAAPGPSPQQFQYPPEMVEMMRWMGSFRQNQEQLQQRQAREAQEAQAQMAQQVMGEIEAFRAKPEARFFSAVQDHMTVLLAQGLAQTLEEAYDQAIHARPDIRNLLAQEAEAKRRQEAERQARVRQARVRGGSVRGSVGGSPPDRNRGSVGSVRDDINAAIAEVNSRY